ncbi:MAG: diacylglycerol kinase [Alphaproteobacteria bacterium]|nr:diacylglycerol kinase [Alphaproteobacteria bacterium]
MKSHHKGIKRILNAFTYSYDGFKEAFFSETAFRQDLFVVILGLFSLLFLPLTLQLKALLFFSLMLILLMELVNTAIETIVDRISDDYHLLSKKAKDIGSLLVLMSFFNAFVCWTLVLIPFVLK